MNLATNEIGYGLLQQISLDSPVIESFFDAAYAAKVWPKDIVTNKVFLAQIKMRQKLNEHLDDILKSLPKPDVPFEDAIKQGHIKKEQVVRIYNSLSDLLESDSDYQRLVFYLPFEFLPSSMWRPLDKELQVALNRFRQVYLEAWKSLLTVQDVRANFADGDVLEVEKRYGEDLPRVVKAAHLIPVLVKKGLINAKDIDKLMEESDDDVLRYSIADALWIVAEQELLTKEEITSLIGSQDRFSGLVRIIFSRKKAKEKSKTVSNKISLLSVQEKLAKKFFLIEAEDHGDVTEKRTKWLKQKQKQEAIEDLGKDISTAIIEHQLPNKVAESFLTAKANVPSQQVLIEGVRIAIESIAIADIKKAQTLYSRHRETLQNLWKHGSPEVKEAFLKTIHRFHRLDVVDDKQLAALNIVMPTLAGPFSKNLQSIEKELQDIQNMVNMIKLNATLSKFIYPLVLVYGSCLKGYGGQNTDIDIGVFVKPDAPFNQRKTLQQLLQKTFAHKRIKGEIVEFWLKETKGQLRVCDFSELDISLGKSDWAHVLFGAAWIGDKKVMKQLRQKLLSSYLYESDEEIDGRPARSVYLEQLEHDTLLYRLMHKGYQKFYPPCGSIRTLHTDKIDGHSMFWDSGYRQLAIKLFTRMVFLPKIARS